jgi:Kef-type K+ transport system membrane component KefB
MHESLFSALSLVIVLATVMALFMRLIKQPLIIGYILTGIIVGPSVLHVLKSPSTIAAFSNIGIALLLFIIGLGLNLKVVKEVGRVAAIVGSIQVILITLFGWWMGKLLGLDYKEAIFLGLALSFSSTIITLKLLSDKKEQARLYGKITIGILIIQDLLAAAALLFVTSQGHNSSVSVSELGWLAAKGIGAGLALFIIGGWILPKLHKFIAGSQEFLFLFAIGWGFGCAALFEGIGFSLEIGALLGGIALASLPFAQEISARLRPLRDFFVVVFFISLGSRISFGSLGSDVRLIIASILVVVILKPLVVMVVMGIMGYTKQTSFKTAASLGQISEFSLVLVFLGNSVGIVPSNLVDAITVVALISIAISTYFINYADSLFKLLERSLSIFERSNPHKDKVDSVHYELVLFGYKKGGEEFVKIFERLKRSFVVIDYDPKLIDLMDREHINCIYGDATDIELLEELGIDKAHMIVSTISDHATNVFMLRLIERRNPGASYVIIPHYIGTEKIGAFVRKSGLKKSEFKKYQQKHLAYLKSHYALSDDV